MGTRPRPLTERARNPFADRMNQLEQHLADPEVCARIKAAVEATRTADRVEGEGETARTVKGRRTTNAERCVNVLRLLTSRTNPVTGLAAESIEQLAAANPFTSTDQIRRTLAALHRAGEIETVRKGYGANPERGIKARPNVYRVTALTAGPTTVLVHSPEVPADAGDPFADPVDNSSPEGTPSRTSARCDDGTIARGTPDHRALDADSSVSITTGADSIGGETLIGDTHTPARNHELDATARRWVLALTAEVKRKHSLPPNPHGPRLTELAAVAYDRWGALDLAAHADRLGAWIVDTMTAGPPMPALIEELDRIVLDLDRQVAV